MVALQIHCDFGDSYHTPLCLMIDKNMKLGNVFEQIGSIMKENYPMQSFVFKPYQSYSGTSNMITNDSLMMEEFKQITNASFFDMNTEFRNLNTLNLELVERNPRKARRNRSELKFMKNSFGPFSEEDLKEKKHSHQFVVFRADPLL